jgi:hypothetical protein
VGKKKKRYRGEIARKETTELKNDDFDREASNGKKTTIE